MQTSVPTAEFGRGMGAEVNAVLRSGANSLHGSAFEYFRNTVLDATDYFVKHSNPRGLKPVLNRNQFGATLGGPIWKDHTFFFLSYEGFRQVAPQVTTTLVPTAAQRAAVTDPVSKQLLQFFPLPNYSASGTNFISNVRNVLNDDTGMVKIDHQLGSKDHLLGHYIVYNGRQIVGGVIPTTGGYTNSPASRSAVSGRRSYLHAEHSECAAVGLLVQRDEVRGAGLRAGCGDDLYGKRRTAAGSGGGLCK